MIKLELSIREAMELAFYAREDIRERITQAFEVALGVDQNRTVTITGGMSTDNRIPCIKAIRINTGWGLKEAKDWTDVLVGPGTKQSITLRTAEAAQNLLRDLVALGCEGYIS